MARYARGDEFWDFSRDGTTITIVTGKIGEAGMTTVETLASPALAVTRERVLLNKQARDGWKLYKPPVAAPEPVGPSLPPPPTVYDARNPELEHAILEDPDNDSLYEVYGDWLQSQGDPRGKLIALERACIDKPFGDKHHAAKGRWVNEHREYLYGGIDTDVAQLFHGFVRSIEIRDGDLAPRIEKAVAAPAARFLTRIVLDRDEELGGADGAADLAKAIEIVGRKAPKTLRRLDVGGATTLSDLGPVVKRLPELEEFSIASVGSRALTVDAKVVKTIARSPWPRLECLTLELADGDWKVTDLEALFARTDLPALTALYLRTPRDPDLVTALLASPLAAQLEDLGVSYLDDWTPDGHVVELLEGLNRLPKLANLQLPRGRLSKELDTRLGQLRLTLSDGDESRFDAGYE